jgi:hypothetical protein
LADQIAMMQFREKAAAEILEKLSARSQGFTRPRLVLIGG